MNAGGFDRVFGGPPQAVGEAPGRVNLLGEHTDYNDGFVLPIAIAQRTRVAMRRSAQPRFSLYAEGQGGIVDFALDSPPAKHHASYVYGCIMQASSRAGAIPPLEIHVDSDVPMGVGLSSSAALEVATLRCLRQLLDLPLDDVLIAQLAQRAEIQYAGVNCGIMDQMASSLADPSRALLLDTRTLERRFVELPAGAGVLVIDSGVSRSLAASGYNQRRRECEEAARLLGVSSLRHVASLEQLSVLPDTLKRRARHVVSENTRVLRAVACTSAPEFGQLMNASHASLRDDYEVSTPELDRLVDLLQRQQGVHGARLTGAGFGGACVALCQTTALQAAAATVLHGYRQLGLEGKVLVPPPPDRDSGSSQSR
jgi:galactokinase